MHPRPNIGVSTLYCIQDIYKKINLKILDNLILLFVVSHFVLEKLTLFQGLNPHSAFLHPETKSISTLSWMECYSITELSPALNSLLLIYTCIWVDRGTVRVSCPRTKHDVSNHG